MTALLELLLPHPSPLSRLQRLEATCPLYLEAARRAIREAERKGRQAQVARARAVGAERDATGARDFGPSIRVARGDVVAEYRADPDPGVGPLVHGGRVRDGLRAMFNHKHITLPQWQAACRLRDDIDLANGVALDVPDNAGVRGQPNGRLWPDEVQLAALARVRDVWLLLPEPQRAVADWMLVDGGTITAFAKLRRMRKADAGELLQQALDAIVEFYDRED